MNPETALRVAVALFAAYDCKSEVGKRRLMSIVAYIRGTDRNDASIGDTDRWAQCCKVVAVLTRRIWSAVVPAARKIT